MGERRVIEYRAADGKRVELVVDWPVGTGRIPPPAIEFYDHQLDARVKFFYSGEGDEVSK